MAEDGRAGTAPPRKEQVGKPCEVCAHSGSTLWRMLRYPQFGHPGTFELRRCDACGLVFNSPRLIPDELARLYDRNYYIFNEPVAAAFVRVVGLHHATVARLERRLASTATVLEVGSAKGYMLALLRARGWKAEGVELSQHAAAFANDRLDAPTYHGTLEDWVDEPTHVPRAAAYSTDVIEHVPSPRRFLESLHRAVEPGGLVLIGTPNVESDGVAAFGDEWLGFNPFHIWLFSPSTLGALLGQCGFEVLETYSFGNVVLGREPERSTLHRWVRDGLARVGLLSALRRWRSGPSSETSRDALSTLRTGALDVIAGATPWDDTDDGRHARARSSRGDNLVVLARRSPRPHRSNPD